MITAVRGGGQLAACEKFFHLWCKNVNFSLKGEEPNKKSLLTSEPLKRVEHEKNVVTPRVFEIELRYFL